MACVRCEGALRQWRVGDASGEATGPDRAGTCPVFQCVVCGYVYAVGEAERRDRTGERRGAVPLFQMF